MRLSTIKLWVYFCLLALQLRIGITIDHNPLLDIVDEGCSDLARYVPSLMRRCTVLQMRNQLLNEPLGGHYLDVICFYIRNGHISSDLNVDSTAPSSSEISGSDYFLLIFENIKNLTNNFTEYYRDICPPARNRRLSAADEIEQSKYSIEDISRLQDNYRAILQEEARRSETLPTKQEDSADLNEDGKQDVNPFSLLPNRTPVTPLSHYIHDKSRILPDVLLKYDDFKTRILHSLITPKIQRPLPTISDLSLARLGVGKIPTLHSNIPRNDKLDIVQAAGPQSKYHGFINGNLSSKQLEDIYSKSNPIGPLPSISPSRSLEFELGKHPLHHTILPDSRFRLSNLNKDLQSVPRNIPPRPRTALSSLLNDNSKSLKSPLSPNPAHTSPLLPEIHSLPKIPDDALSKWKQILERHPHLRTISGTIHTLANNDAPRLPVAFGLDPNLKSSKEDEIKTIEDETISSDITKSLSTTKLPIITEYIINEKLEKLKKIEEIISAEFKIPINMEDVKTENLDKFKRIQEIISSNIKIPLNIKDEELDKLENIGETIPSDVTESKSEIPIITGDVVVEKPDTPVKVEETIPFDVATSPTTFKISINSEEVTEKLDKVEEIVEKEIKNTTTDQINN